jgi:hypothetical protein
VRFRHTRRDQFLTLLHLPQFVGERGVDDAEVSGFQILEPLLLLQ